MPRKKGQSKAQNLGNFALKRKGDHVEQNEVQPTKRSRNASPMDSSNNQQTDPSNDSDADAETEAGIEIQEENDVPHPRDQADLLQWLQLSDAHLDSLPTTTAPVRRGPYHSRKIGADISERREQELRKLKKEREAREAKEDATHGRKKTAITDFFSQQTLPPQEPELEPDSPSEEPFTTDAEMEIDSQGGLPLEESASLPNSNWSDSEMAENCVDQVSSSHASVIDLSDSPESDIVEEIAAKSSTSRVTLEVVEDEDDVPLNVEPCELSPEARAEEGLDELPWDPSEDIIPRAADSLPLFEQLPEPAPQERLPEPARGQPLPPGSATYFHHERGFIMPNRPQPRKIPSQVPSNSSVDSGIQSLQTILHPKRNTGHGHRKNNLDLVTTARLECMIRFLRLYKASGYAGWTLHSDTVAVASGKSGTKTWLGRKICQWAIEFCADHKRIPNHMYGHFKTSILTDEDVAGDIHLHLQSLGKWASGKDIVRYVATPEFQARLSVKRTITIRTAQRWMRKMGYRWKKEPKGMYSDGHEREDVVNYRQNVFLPRWRDFESRSRWYNGNQTEEQIEFDAKMRAFMSSALDARVVVIWRHDESTFYSHDRRDVRWVHNSERAKIKAKGQGASQMVGDFVSDVYGWMKSKKPNADG
ncbi:hypothetical protein K438DRAFT_1789555 [Mycena galopus ATCC 62051]|nr:hypothetical protein K438DRAFT_1789555 [Mycena galopus ATCC 62051]